MNTFNYEEAYARNIGIFSKERQERVRKSTVGIIGLGGTGGVYATTCARLGISSFHLADFDVYERVNINRQEIANKNTLGIEKTKATREAICAINEEAQVTLFEEGILESTIDVFLLNVDVVFDAIDFFSLETRRLFYDKAREKGIYVITACPVGYGSSMLVFSPTGMSFDEYFAIDITLTETEKLIRFGLGLTPSLMQRSYFDPSVVDWKNHKAPSLVLGTLLCANMACTYAIKILFKEKIHVAPHSFHMDPYIMRLKKVYMPLGNKNPIQILKRHIMTYILKKKGVL